MTSKTTSRMTDVANRASREIYGGLFRGVALQRARVIDPPPARSPPPGPPDGLHESVRDYLNLLLLGENVHGK